MKVLFIQTGGTIDKNYPAGVNNHGYNFEITEPAFDRILKRIKPKFEYEAKLLLKKDSLDLEDKDRALILETCQNSSFDKIIITHGTDTMSQTAQTLAAIKDKTIVITGAMLPEKFKDSDADFNLGTAIGALSSLPPGIYIALHGQVFPT